jgi:zinc D-Ala-D-Ala carboxypeptidase
MLSSFGIRLAGVPRAAYGGSTVGQPRPGMVPANPVAARDAMTRSPRAYAHARDVPVTSWRWPSFTPDELACRGTGALLVDPRALDMLQSLRNRLGRPMIVTSAYRSPAHNARVGGAARSRHLQGIAFDVRMDNHDPEAFVAQARAVGFHGIGTYPRQGFVHIDARPAAEAAVWGDPFPKRATRFAPEAPPRRPSLAGSRTLAGAGAAGAAVVAAGAAELAQEAAGEAAALPWLAHLDTARWLLLAAALVGIAVVVRARIGDWKKMLR